MIRQLKYRYVNSKFGQKKNSTQFVYFVFFALVAWFAYGMIFKTEKTEEVLAPSIVRVDVEKTTQKNVLSDILVYGQTKASEKVDLKVRTAGIVDKIYKRKGQQVKKGDVILTIKMEDRLAKLNAAKAVKEKAEIEFNTAKSLLAQDLISRVEFVANEAAYKSAKATLDDTIRDIEFTELRAPFDGIVNTLDIEEGSFVAKESTVGEFLNLNTIKITAQIPEKYISRVRKGVVANAMLSDGTKVDALLTYVDAIANSATRTFAVELEANNKDKKLVEGLTAELRLPLNTVSAMKLKVSSCLTFGEDGSVGVKTIDSENIVHFYPVELVKEEEDGIWVSGLPENANVIIAGGEYVRVGEKVEPHFVNEKEKIKD